MRQLTCGSLFAGIGGFDLGFERAGIKTIWQVEIDEYCRRVLAKHFPDAERFGDIRECGAHNLKPVDILCGGFPCQDISYAGKGAGLEGERSGLWREYQRIICELRPGIVVVENVAALLERGMGEILADLAAMGYDAEWRCISARQVGALHLRERIWIVAYPNGNEVGFTTNTAAKEGGKLRNESLCESEGLGEVPLLNSDYREERVQGFLTEAIPRFREFSWCESVRRVEDLRGRPDLPEPLFRGSHDGIPYWMDRVGALGNSIVPQIAEWIGRRIVEAA